MVKILYACLISTLLIGSGLSQISSAQTAGFPAATVYSVVNDDVPVYENHRSSGTVYVNGVYQSKINTGSYGIGGGYLGIHDVDIDIVDSQNQCVFIADAGGVSGNGPGDVFAFNAATRTGTNVVSAFGYNATLYGIGIVHQGNVLVAAWGGSGELETFTIGSGCTLTPANSSATGFGLSGGIADGLAFAPNGQFVVATYEDNSYGIYPIAGANIGAPAQYVASCSNSNFLASPVGLAISPDSSTVYLDCLYGENGALIDAFTMANPSVTVTNGPIFPASGTPVNGSVTMALSPNGKVLYIVGTFSGAIESANVNGTSVTANDCTTVVPPGYNSQWIYPGTVSVLGSGAGRGLAIPQVAFGNTPDSYLELLKIDANNCVSAYSQGTDANSKHGLSGASYVRE